MYFEAALGVMTELPIVIKGKEVVVVGPDIMGKVLLPTTTAYAEGAREMRVPDMVMAGAPGISVWLPIKYSEALLGSIVVPSRVSGGRGVALAMSATVMLPEGARASGVPETVISGPPGRNVCPSMTN